MEEVGNLLQEVAKEVDLLAVISHDKEFLDETCPYVIQLEQGKLVDTYQLATNGDKEKRSEHWFTPFLSEHEKSS